MKMLILFLFMLSCSSCYAKTPETTGIMRTDKAISTGLIEMPSDMLISETTKPIQMIQTELMRFGIIMPPSAPESLVITSGGGWIKICSNGKIEFENVTLDKAAQEFWKKVSDAFPQFKENILKEAAEEATRKEGGFFVPVPNTGL